MKHSTLSSILAALALSFACGGGSSDPDARTSIDSSTSPTATAHFVAPTPNAGGDWGTVPFPSDLYLDGDGLMTLTSLPTGPGAQEQFVDQLIEGVHSMDGAGVWSAVFFPVDGGDLDPATLAGNVKLVDLENSLAEIPVDLLWRSDLKLLVAVPKWGYMLEEKHSYAAYVTNGVKATDDTALAAPAMFLEAADLATTPSDPAIAAAQTSLRPLLEGLGSDASTVVTATVFRTETVTETAVKMRQIAIATTPVVTADTLYTTSTELEVIFGDQLPDAPPGVFDDAGRGQPHGQVAAVIHGTITLPNFLTATPGVDGFPTFDGNGDPEIKGTHTVKYTLILPTGGSWADIPVVVYLHGINRTRADMITQADTATRRGFAVMAIDVPYHGDRFNTPTDERNDITEVMTPDGFGDAKGLLPAVALFHLTASGGIGQAHPQAMRENLRQGAIDMCSLVEFIVNGDVGPIQAALNGVGGLPTDLSFRNDVGVVAESLGVFITGVMVAIEPRVKVAHFSSPASGMPFPSMLHSPYFSALFFNAIANPFGLGDRLDLGDPNRGARVEPIVNLYNSVLEQGEASGFARVMMSGERRGGTGPHLNITMSWADESVSNDTQEHYVGAMGLPRLLTPNAPSTPPSAYLRYADNISEMSGPIQGNLYSGTTTGAVTVYYPSAHAVIRKLTHLHVFEPEFPPFVELADPVLVDPTPIVEIHEQWGTMFADYFGGTDPPRIIDPYAN